jgi:hypothetical protein
MVDDGKCAFCDFELKDNTADSSVFDYHICCKDHKNYATYPQMWLLRKEYGQPYTEPAQELKVCSICHKPLTEKEFGEIKNTHINFTCTLHRRAAFDVNIDISRRKYGYTEAYTQRTINDIIKVWGF